jgi:DNA-binding XRE family transcriptional regulator
MKNVNVIDNITKVTGLSQLQLADRVGVSKSTISAWRMGAPIPPIQKRRLMQIMRMKRRISSTHNDVFDTWRLLVKSPKNSRNWHTYMRSLGINLHKDWKKVLITLNELGIHIPSEAPDRVELKSTYKKLKHDEDFDLESTWEEEEVESSAKLKPLDILLSKLLTNINVLDEWCELFLPKTRDGEITNKARLIQYMLVDIAFVHIDTDLFLDLEVDFKPILVKNTKTKNKASKLIESLCEELISDRKNLRTDYFELIRVSPSHLLKTISDYEISSMSEPNIDDYLSYGEKRIYEAIKENMRLQNKLIERLEVIRKDGIENTQIIKSNEGLLSKIKEGLIQNF